MHTTPKATYELLARIRAPCERQAVLHDHICSGRSTMEHAWVYGGKQITEAWAIVRLCWVVHLGSGLNKEINHYLSLRHADIQDLKQLYPRKDWEQEWRYLSRKYG